MLIEETHRSLCRPRRELPRRETTTSSALSVFLQPEFDDECLHRPWEAWSDRYGETRREEGRTESGQHNRRFNGSLTGMDAIIVAMVWGTEHGHLTLNESSRMQRRSPTVAFRPLVMKSQTQRAAMICCFSARISNVGVSCWERYPGDGRRAHYARDGENKSK